MAKRTKMSSPSTSQQKVAVPSTAERPGSHVAIGLGLILLTTFLIYLPAMNGDPIWDDDANLTRPELRSLDGLYRIWFDPADTASDMQYYPLVHTAFWIEHKLWGNDYFGYHLVNVLWHSVAVLLVYSIVTHLRIPGALLAAAIFAFHPVMVESVAWMTEQKNTLSTVFYLSAMLAHLEFDRSRRRSRHLIALGLFALALLCKTAWVTLPFALLVIFWWQRGTISWRRDVLPLVPFFALSVVAGLMTIWVEWKLVGAEGTEFDLTFLERALLAGRDIWFYLGKLAWPTNLSFTYPRWTIDAGQWWQWTFSIAALATTVALFAIGKRWRGPLAGWLLFCGTLAPVLGFLNVYMFKFTFVADHLQYLPSLGIIVPTSAGIALGLERASPSVRRCGIALCILLLGTLAVISFRQSRKYDNVSALYRATLELNPASWLTHNNLGTQLSAAGQQQAAIEHYREALRLKPDYYQAHTNLGAALAGAGQWPEAFDHLHKAVQLRPASPDVHRNLGNALAKSGRVREAIDELEAARGLRPDDPLTLNSLGGALTQMGRTREAIEQLQHAVQIKPDYAEAHSNLGNALLAWRRLPEAIDELHTAVMLKPDDSGAMNNLGIALLQAGRFPEAIDQLARAVRLDPSAEAHNNLGNALTKASRLPEAIDELRAALALKPDYVGALNNLGIALTRAGRFPEAIENLEHAVRLKPDFADAHNNLGAAQSHVGKIPEAIEQFRQTVKLNPNDFNAHNNLGLLLLEAGDTQQSLVHLNQAVRLRPDLVDGYANLALALNLANRSDDAIAAAQQGIKIARSTGQESAAEQIEQWLSQHQTELRRSGDAESTSEIPPPTR